MKSSLKDVYRLAVHDKKFLNLLLKDPEKACAAVKPEKLELSAGEMKLLKKTLNKKTALTSAEMLGYVHTIVTTASVAGDTNPKKPWPPPPAWWPKLEMQPGPRRSAGIVKAPEPPPNEGEA